MKRLRFTACRYRHVGVVAFFIRCCGLVTVPLSAQLDQNCTVSILNRSAPIGPDGSGGINNVPVRFGPVRARATCLNELGFSQSGQTGYATFNTIFGLIALIAAPSLFGALALAQSDSDLEKRWQAACSAEEYARGACDSIVEELETLSAGEGASVEHVRLLARALWNSSFEASDDQVQLLRTRARAVIDAGTSRFPNAADLEYLRAVFSADTDGRIESLTRTLELDPDNREAIRLLARLHVERSAVDMALPLYQRMLREGWYDGRSDLSDYVSLARELVSTGNGVAAQDVLGQAFDLVVDQPLRDRCYLYSLLDARLSAVEIGERAASLRELCGPLPLFEQGVAALRDGDTDRAVMSFERQAALEPRRPEPYEALITIAEQASDSVQVGRRLEEVATSSMPIEEKCRIIAPRQGRLGFPVPDAIARVLEDCR